MDFSLLVIIWIVILVVEQVAGKKKKKPPTPTETTDNADFNIPTLANDPNFPGEDVTVFRDEQKAAEVREVGFTEMYRQRKAEFQADKKSSRNVDTTARDSAEKTSNLPLGLNAESAMNAIVLSEILGKPKALRRKF